MSKQAELAKTANNNKTGNVYKHIDTVLILFDLPLAAKDDPGHEVFELSPKRGKPQSKSRAKKEDVEDVEKSEMRSYTRELLWNGQVAIRFQGLKPGDYRLTRADGRKEPQEIFVHVPDEHLTGTPAKPNPDPPHQLFHEHFWLKEATDPDLKGTLPDFTSLSIPEPQKVK